MFCGALLGVGAGIPLEFPNDAKFHTPFSLRTNSTCGCSSVRLTISTSFRSKGRNFTRTAIDCICAKVPCPNSLSSAMAAFSTVNLGGSRLRLIAPSVTGRPSLALS